jgi:hypothetical protein
LRAQATLPGMITARRPRACSNQKIFVSSSKSNVLFFEKKETKNFYPFWYVPT